MMTKPHGWCLLLAAARFTISMEFSLLLCGCILDSDGDGRRCNVTTPMHEDHSTIADPRERWKAYGLSRYAVREVVSCFCSLPGPYRLYVHDNRIVKILSESDGRSVPLDRDVSCRTVEELFDLLAEAEADSHAIYQVRFDPRFGYPAFLAIDWMPTGVDDEVRYEVSGLERWEPCWWPEVQPQPGLLNGPGGTGTDFRSNGTAMLRDSGR